jgi:hypothetical protein
VAGKTGPVETEFARNFGAWMLRFGLFDPDAEEGRDGVSSRAEFDARTDPTLANRQDHSEEWAGLFRERLARVNPSAGPAEVTVTFLPGSRMPGRGETAPTPNAAVGGSLARPGDGRTPGHCQQSVESARRGAVRGVGNREAVFQGLVDASARPRVWHRA